MQEVTWGKMQSLGTTATVRFVGDSSDVPVRLRNPDIVGLAVGDKVCLVRLGPKDGWMILSVIEPT